MEEEEINLKKSLENVSLYRARYSSQITKEQKMDLMLNELQLFKKEVELKTVQTHCKANSFRILNTLFSLAILSFSAVIIGLQAASDCVNIAVIVLSSGIFLIEGAHKLFRWGPQGIMYKNASIKLKRLTRQSRDYMYIFHRYTTDQLMSIISRLRTEYDDIDISLYRTSITGAAKYNTGLDIEQGGGGNFEVPPALQLNRSGGSNRESDRESPHVHIHFPGHNTPLPATPLPLTPTVSVSTPPLPATPFHVTPSVSTPPLSTPPTVVLPEKSNSAPISVSHRRTRSLNNHPTIEVEINDSL